MTHQATVTHQATKLLAGVFLCDLATWHEPKTCLLARMNSI